MLYHTFLVVMLGSVVLAKSVQGEVQLNDSNLMFWRDHSERYLHDKQEKYCQRELEPMVTFLLRVKHCCSKCLAPIPSGKYYMQVFQMISIKMLIQYNVISNMCALGLLANRRHVRLNGRAKLRFQVLRV